MSDHFSLWEARLHADRDVQKRARDRVFEFNQRNSDFAKLCKTPQTSPYHTEGPTVQDHIERALTVLFALQRGSIFIDVDEWRADVHYRGFFRRLQETIIAEKPLLTAYILAHDIGKKDVVTKDEQGIVHYPNHAHKSAEEAYASFRLECLTTAECPRTEARLLRELIRVHWDIIEEIGKSNETHVLRFAYEIARRRGINEQRFLRILPAAYMLDALLGSVPEHESAFLRAQRMSAFARAEYAEFPERQEEDQLQEERLRKNEQKQIYSECGITPELWFDKLQTPFGKERGKVAEIIQRFIRGVEREEDVRYVGNQHAALLRIQSERAQKRKEEIRKDPL